MVVLMRLQEAKQMERLTLDDMIKALKCVASQDTVGDCYADHENFIHMDDEHKRVVCGTGEDLRDYVSGKEAIGCPYHQNIYGCCVEVGELYWLKDVAELLEELKKYREIGTIEECQVAMEKFIEEAQLHEALRVLDERM